MHEIKKARKIMQKAFRKDKFFKLTYISNIAMILYDNNIVLGLEKRNDIAEKILERIFCD